MKYYAVAEIDITDRNWVGDYVKNVTRLVERAGGRYLARTSRIEKMVSEVSLSCSSSSSGLPRTPQTPSMRATNTDPTVKVA